jgi:hypothetical protein
MTSKSKNIIVAALVVIVGVGAYVGYTYYKIVKAYNTTLTPDEADTIINQQTSTVSDGDIIPDDISDSADATKGTSAQ